jgi:hypothetical protein
MRHVRPGPGRTQALIRQPWRQRRLHRGLPWAAESGLAALLAAQRAGPFWARSPATRAKVLLQAPWSERWQAAYARATISATRRPRPRPRARMQWPHSIRHIPPVCAAAGTRCKRAASHATAQAVRLKAPRMDIETRRCKPRFASSRCNSRCRFEMCSFAGRVINASPVRRVADASRRDAASYRGLPCGHSCWYQRSTWRCAAWRLVG